MTAYRRVYDLRHLQADCQEPGSAPEPYARYSSMGYLYLIFLCFQYGRLLYNKKLSCRRGTARCVVSVEILPIATQQ